MHGIIILASSVVLFRRAHNACAKRELVQATEGAEEGFRSLGAAREIVQKARTDQAEGDARAKKTSMAARFASYGRAPPLL